MKQLSFFPKVKKEFGGSLLTGKRKSQRPLDSKMPLHLVLKATNSNLLLRKIKVVENVAHKFADRFGIRIYQFGIHADHVHIAMKIPNRASYVRWIRAVASMLVQLISGLKWGLRPYSRISSWGRAFRKLCDYVFKNKMEGERILAAHLYIEGVVAEVYSRAERGFYG